MKSPLNRPAGRTPPPRLRNAVEIEDIDRLRRRAGIEDTQLHDEIRLLRIGDTVNLTFLKDAVSGAGETLAVRITFIRSGCFRGNLASEPRSTYLSALQPGCTVIFKTTHIHSIPKRGPPDEQFPHTRSASSPSPDR
jgi:hypothetical protein